MNGQEAAIQDQQMRGNLEIDCPYIQIPTYIPHTFLTLLSPVCKYAKRGPLNWGIVAIEWKLDCHNVSRRDECAQTNNIYIQCAQLYIWTLPRKSGDENTS